MGPEGQKEEVPGSYQNLEAWTRSPRIWDLLPSSCCYLGELGQAVLQWLFQNQTNKCGLLLSVKHYHRPWRTLHRCQINNSYQDRSHGLDLDTSRTFALFILDLKLPRIIALVPRSRQSMLNHTTELLLKCLYQKKLAYLKSIQNKPREIKQSETITSFS